MRKLIGAVTAVTVLAFAAVALAAPPATSPNGYFIDLNVSVSPPVAGTAKKPQSVGVTFDSFTGNRVNGNLQSNNNAITVRFNRGFKENAKLFPSCKISVTTVSNCANNTKIGTGTAEAALAGAAGAPPTFVPVSLTAYNGKPFNGSDGSIIFIAPVAGQKLELDFAIRNQPSGPYGLSYSELIFPSTSTSSTPSFELTKFRITIPSKTVTMKIHGKRVKVPLISAPTSCHGSWKFEQVNGFAGAPPLTATDTQPCARS